MAETSSIGATTVLAMAPGLRNMVVVFDQHVSVVLIFKCLLVCIDSSLVLYGIPVQRIHGAFIRMITPFEVLLYLGLF